MSIAIITEGVLSAFADLVQANNRRLYRVWLIAPWIGSAESGSDPVFRIVQALSGSPCRLVIVTRPPVAAWHLRAIQSLRRHSNHEVLGSAALHSKLYIAECNGFRAAIFGSPNLTPAADEQNQELAVEFRSSKSGREDPTSAIISELLSYAARLRTHDDVVPLE
jgi:phosphatidylserine/phosphatidylglycerophosphate/cardiolipin synthase-like enzyme